VVNAADKAAAAGAAMPPPLHVAGIAGVGAAATALAAGGPPPPGLMGAGSVILNTGCDIALSVYPLAHWTGVKCAGLWNWLSVSAPAWLRIGR